jgi:hypothetical protein
MFLHQLLQKHVLLHNQHALKGNRNLGALKEKDEVTSSNDYNIVTLLL